MEVIEQLIQIINVVYAILFLYFHIYILEYLKSRNEITEQSLCNPILLVSLFLALFFEAKNGFTGEPPLCMRMTLVIPLNS